MFRFVYDLPLDQTMDFETVYHPAMQFTLEEKVDMRNTPGSIFVWMFVEGELAGESYGLPVRNMGEPIEGLDALPENEESRAVYCYSNTILPAFQNRGLGTVLKSHWLGLVSGAGYSIVYGRAREGASQALNASFGAVFLHSFPDCCGTGEEYKLYRLALDGFRTGAATSA